MLSEIYKETMRYQNSVPVLCFQFQFHPYFDETVTASSVKYNHH